MIGSGHRWLEGEGEGEVAGGFSLPFSFHYYYYFFIFFLYNIFKKILIKIIFFKKIFN